MADEQDIPTRVVRLEAQMAEVRADVGEIKQKLSRMATKEDVEGIKGFFEDRDATYGDRMWWITKALMLLFAAAVITAFGIQQIPKLR